MFANKLIEKTPNHCNAKERYQSFIKIKQHKITKTIKIITYQLKTFENPNIVDMKSIITKHPKTLHKLSNTVRQLIRN